MLKRILELEQSVTTLEEKLRSAEERLIANHQTNVRTYRTGVKLNLYSTNKPYKYSIARGQEASTNQVPNTSLSSSNIARRYEQLEVKPKVLSKDDSLNEVKSSSNRPKRRKLYNIGDFID